jgi:hypothetical protein
MHTCAVIPKYRPRPALSADRIKADIGMMRG